MTLITTTLSRPQALLHEGAIDLGLIPCIEYLQGDYRLVPGVGIGSKGAIATVALYARGPLMSIRRMAMDTSSRTSVALVKILCRHRFQINPEFVPSPPDLKTMTRDCEAALLIGDRSPQPATGSSGDSGGSPLKAAMWLLLPFMIVTALVLVGVFAMPAIARRWHRVRGRKYASSFPKP